MKKYIILIFCILLGLSWYTAISDAINDPKELEAHLQKAEELEEKGIYVDAVTEYEAALEYAPEQSEIQLNLARVYLLSDEPREFIKICEKQAEENQENEEALDMLMEYYIDDNNYTDALQYLKEFRESYPENENAWKWYLELEGTYEELYCRFDILTDIVNNSMAVASEGLSGIADETGSRLIACEYAEANPFSEDGYALVQREDGTYIYIDKNGQTRKVPDTGYEELGMFESDRATAKRNGKYGFLNEDMEPMGDFVWEKLSGMKNDTAAGKMNGEWVILDDEGEIKTEARFEDVIMDDFGFCSLQDRMFVKQNGRYFLADLEGEQVGSLYFDDAKAFTENGYAAVCRDGKWGYISTEGELVIDYTYEDAASFRYGFAAIYEDGLWGYIDEEGNIAIEPRFIAAGHLSEEGTAVICERTQEEETWKIIQLNVFQ